MNIRPILVAGAALATLTFATDARAQSTIRFDPASLSEPGVAAALYGEIRDAAERACRKEHDGASVLGPRVRRLAVERCVAETVESAVRTADAAALTAQHEPTTPTRLLAARE